MADVLEEVVRVGLAGWVGQSEDGWDAPPVLGTIGDQLYLVEIDVSNRERVLSDLIDSHEADDRSLRIEIALFGDAGGFFSSPLNFLELWPKSLADLPAEVFVDNYYKAAFTETADEIVMTVRHALRPDGPPKRRFRFRPSEYEEMLSGLKRSARSVRDDLIALAEQRAPEKVESLRDAFNVAPPNLGLQLTRSAIDVWQGRRTRPQRGPRS